MSQNAIKVDQHTAKPRPATPGQPTDQVHRSDVFKEKLGVSLDELFEGFRFVRKEDGHFVFSDGVDEIKFNLASVKRALSQRVEEERNAALLVQLVALGLFRVSFTLPSLSLIDEGETHAVIQSLNETNTHAVLEVERGENRQVHLSLLRDLQSERLIRELKELELGFLLLTLGYTVKRLKEISEQLFHPQNESARVQEAGLTLMRLRRLIVERLDEQAGELRGLSYSQLNDLRDELEEGLAQVGTGEMVLLTLYMSQLESVGARIKILAQSEHLHRLNNDNLIELFSPDDLREDLIEAMINAEEINQTLRERLHRCMCAVRDRSDRTFTIKVPDQMDLSGFVERLFELQTNYINTQLRIGRLDFALIRRFRVMIVEEGNTSPILRDYKGVTSHERLNLYRELIEHRLNLLFTYQLVDQNLRDHAHYSVNDFYRIFYQLTNQI